MGIQIRSARRIASGFAAIALTLTALVPLLSATVDAAQLTTRSIQISSSAASATNVAYQVGFTVSNAATNIGGIVIDYCSNSPIIGDTCTAPTGFNVNRATLSVNNQTNISGLSVYTSDATDNRVILTRTAGAPAGAALSFALGNATSNGITNSSTVGTFYARIYTYTTSAAAQGHNTNVPTGYTDYGGIALSTANTIGITARVMETLVFCVSGSTPTTACGGVTAPSVTLGHGTPAVIDAGTVDTNTSDTPTYTQVSTNAASGVTVRMKNSNACGGLSKDGGATCDIAPVNAGGTSGPIAAGSAKFGLGVAASSGGTGTVAPTAKYASSTGYGMDPSNSTGVTSTYGDAIESSAGPVSSVNNQLIFAATAGNTTPAGIYTATMTLIATGVF